MGSSVSSMFKWTQYTEGVCEAEHVCVGGSSGLFPDIRGVHMCLCVSIHVCTGGDGRTTGKSPPFLCMALLGYRHKGPGPSPTPESSMAPTGSTPAHISGPEARPTCAGSSPRAHRADRKCRNHQALP